MLFKLVSNFSSVASNVKTINQHFNLNFAIFIKELFALHDRGFVFALLHEYLKGVRKLIFTALEIAISGYIYQYLMAIDVVEFSNRVQERLLEDHLRL